MPFPHLPSFSVLTPVHTPVLSLSATSTHPSQLRAQVLPVSISNSFTFGFTVLRDSYLSALRCRVL